MANAATLIDGLVLKSSGYTYTGAALSTTATSYADISSVTSTLTVAAGQRALVMFTANCSNSNTGVGLAFQIVEDGTARQSSEVFFHTTSTLGNIKQVAMIYQATAPSAGSHTWKVQWKNITSATGYLGPHTFNVILFQHQ